MRRQDQANANNDSTPQPLAGGNNASGDGSSSSTSFDDLFAYKTSNDLPPPGKTVMIEVDERNKAILIPLYDTMVPFHVATVKTVYIEADASSSDCHICIIFKTGRKQQPFTPSFGGVYLKEISFRSKDVRQMSEVVQQIKTLKRTFGTLEGQYSDGSDVEPELGVEDERSNSKEER